MFESKLILCPPKHSTWLIITTHPVLERCQYPTWLPSITLANFNLLPQSSRKTKGIVQSRQNSLSNDVLNIKIEPLQAEKLRKEVLK